MKSSMRALLASLALTMLAGPGIAAEVAAPFDGKTLTGWKFKGDEKKSKWQVGTATLDEADPKKMVLKEGGNEMVNVSGGVDIYTDAKFGDAVIEVEVMVPKGSNSGSYLMGEYDIQVVARFGREKIGPGDMGGIYGASAPKVNASKKPGEWQKFVIDLQAPKFEGDKKIANAVVLKVVLNDQVIHENVELKGPTPSGVTGREAAAGPLMFQGDHGPVAYRNIKITPKK